MTNKSFLNTAQVKNPAKDLRHFQLLHELSKQNEIPPRNSPE